jgi:hypothetical protein
MMIVANWLSFLGAPFDAWWHATFGLDLTIWSPPHLHLLIGTVLATLACAVYFLDDAPATAPLQPLCSITPRQIALILTLVCALLIAAFLFLEYEGGLLSRDVRARPRWSYPLLWPCFALLLIALCTSSTRTIGMATVVTALYLVVRLLSVGIDRAVLDFRGFYAYPLVVPALVFDLALLYGRHWAARRLGLFCAGLLATVVLVLTTPLVWSWLDVAPRITVEPWRAYWPIALGSGMLGTVAGWWCGAALRRLRSTAHLAQADSLEQPALAH